MPGRLDLRLAPSPTRRCSTNRCKGNVYLRTNPKHALPDLVASLYSGAVNIVLEGKIGPGKKGGIEAFFSDLPDQPLDKFVMTLDGGKHGLLQNSAEHLRRAAGGQRQSPGAEQHRRGLHDQAARPVRQEEAQRSRRHKRGRR